MWNTVKLKEIVNIDIGKTPSRNNPKYWDNNKKDSNVWVSIRDMSKLSGLYIDDSREYISNEGAELFKEVPKNTLIMSFKLSIGKLAITKINLRTNEAIAALKIKDTTLVCKEYLYYSLSSMNWDKIAGHDIKVKGKTLNKAKLKEILIALPSLTEQQSIIAKLDVVFAEINKILDIELKKKEETKFLIEKINDNIFDKLKNNSKSVKLSSVIKFENGDRGKNYPSKKYQLSVGIPFINAGDLSLDGEITQKGMVYISDDRFNLLGAGKIELDDILFCLRGSLGKCALNKTYKKGAIASSLVIMRPEKKKILPKYLLAYLRSGLIKERIKNTASGTAQPNLSAKTVCNYEIPLPSIEIQELVLNKIEIIKEEYFTLRKIMSQKRDEFKKLKSSILLKKLSNKAA